MSAQVKMEPALDIGGMHEPDEPASEPEERQSQMREPPITTESEKPPQYKRIDILSTYQKTTLLKTLKQYQCNPRQEKEIMKKLKNLKSRKYDYIKSS